MRITARDQTQTNFRALGRETSFGNVDVPSGNPQQNNVCVSPPAAENKSSLYR